MTGGGQNQIRLEEKPLQLFNRFLPRLVLRAVTAVTARLGCLRLVVLEIEKTIAEGRGLVQDNYISFRPDLPRRTSGDY